MKKLLITTALVLAFGIGANAQSLLGKSFDETRDSDGSLTTPKIVSQHNLNDDVDGEGTPLGSGIAVLLGLGAAYMVAKKRKEE